MTKEIFINCTSTETRLALVENAVLRQIHIDRQESLSLVGNIYKAKVLRVMPGMQAAFVDIGDTRNAFIHIDGVHRANSGAKISDVLRDGQDLLVQVIKDPVNKKGALLTTDLSIATEYLVYRQGRSKPGISLQIKPKSERTRLNNMMDSMLSAMALPESLSGNFIMRSAAEGVTQNQLDQDITALLNIWQSIESLRVKKSPTILYKVAEKNQRLVTEMLNLGIAKITIDCPESLEKFERWFDQSSHKNKPVFKLYKENDNMFDTYQLEHQINVALCSEVALACGGNIVIEETEALAVIDVNSGSFIGKSIDQRTYLEVNLEAAVESARQIILRNLSGIIIIDFIDMQNADHRVQVLQQLKQACSQDRIKTVISNFTELGLVQIARKRTSQSLSQVLCEPCSHCDARGFIKTDETIILEIFRQLSNLQFNGKWSALEIYACKSVIKKIENKYAKQLNEFKARVNCDVKLCIESSISSEQFNIIPA
jgi:ribonuclease G